MALLPPKLVANGWLENKADVDFGSWSGLDESSPDKVGVGIFFKRFPDGSMRVISLVPGSSAFRTGLIEIDDSLISLNGELVSNWRLHDLRLKLHGTPGSFVKLELKRNKPEVFSFKINLMRGTPDFMDYQDKYGAANASQIEALLIKKREEQKFNFQVEKCLKIEQDRFAEVQLARKKASQLQDENRKILMELQMQITEEEQALALAEQELAALQDRRLFQ